MNTGATNVTPPAEFYTLASFTMPTVLLDNATGANSTRGCVSQFVSITQNQLVNLTNELQQTAVTEGMIVGG
jgi:pyridoxal/pyridoxine/pyridoxamine kinase